ALPVFAACKRDRVGGAFANAREMLVGGLRIVGETQRDPARCELVLGAQVFLGRRQRIARDNIGCLVLSDIEQLASDKTALDTPFVAIVLLRGSVRRRLQKPRGLDRLVLTAEPLRLVE